MIPNQPRRVPERTRKASLVRRTKWKARKMTKAIAWFRGLSWWRKVLLIGGPIVLIGLIIPLATYAYFARDISNKDHLMNRNNTGVAIYANDNTTVLYSTGRAEQHEMVPLASISKEMRDAVIASEDKDFYKHGGFSVLSTLRAVYSFAVTGGKTFGGSTLTQQLAKITLLSSNRTFLRTYQAFSVAVAIENTYSKDEILEMYLNSAYFGEQAFGVEDAAKYYFDTTPDKLDLAQSSMLVGLLPAPNIYSPISGNVEYAKERQATVLDRMVANDYITKEQKAAAIAEELTYQPAQSIADSSAPHFAQMVLDELYKKYGQETVERSGYRVQTTLDPNTQQILQANVASQAAYIQRNGGSNAGAIAIDPTTGQVRALVGSIDWNNPDWGKVNMATTARQPGSSFKSIYYAQALADGVITPATILHDEPTDFGGGYKPLDADRRFRGDVTVRSAISQSLNIPSVEVLEKLGIKNAVTAANRMGISSIDAKQDYGLSLALGVAEAPLIQMTNAYAAFANGGQQFSPTVIQQISDKYDGTIFKTQEKSKQVISPEGAYLISSILSDNAARAPIFGSSLTVAGRTAAVKTGTTDDSRDAWTIGYTPQLAVGVWVGNNNNDVMLNGGSGMAGPIWVKTMQQALKGTANTQFTVPANVVKRSVCYGTGGLASTSGTNTYEEYFLVTALPTNSCQAAQAPKVEEKPKEEEPATDETKTDETTGSGTTPSTGNGNGNNGNGSGNSGTTTPPSGGSTTPTNPTTPTSPTTP